MKYVITGGAGHISKPLAKKLLATGHSVTVIGRNPENLKELVTAGAGTAIGSVEDVSFLKQALSGADAIYTMVPPNFPTSGWKEWIAKIGSNYAEAIAATGIKYVVNLSSLGAHLAEGAGPISGLHFAEEALNKLKGVNIRHIRPGFFFENFLANVSMVKNAGIIGSNFGGDNFKLVLSDPKDIAEAAFEELNTLKFTGHSVRYIASDERGTDEIAQVIGKAIGKPELSWITFSNDDAYNGMVQAGLPAEVAKNYAEMNNALQTGVAAEDYWKHHPSKFGNVKLEEFAKKFADVYNAN
ncbi:MAG: NmrA family NAD(P)-binding protein [Chitinophagaceae bacterium]